MIAPHKHDFDEHHRCRMCDAPQCSRCFGEGSELRMEGGEFLRLAAPCSHCKGEGVEPAEEWRPW